jgi:polyisoprenoid-binding protein YceI
MNRRFAALIVVLCLVAATAAPNALGACWEVVPQQSRLVFTASQAGGTLQGHFNDYSGRICTPAEDGTPSPIQASVDLASVQTELPELDEALRGSDFFDVARWPKALFEGEVIRGLDDNRYEVTGILELRGVRREITAPLTLRPDADELHASLRTSLTIGRLDYGIGQGEWLDTKWVGDPVEVGLTATLVPALDSNAPTTTK